MSDETVEVRKMTESDLEAVSQIEKLSGLGIWDKNGYQAELNQKDFLLYVAKNQSSDEIIGYISARLITPVLEILNIAVLPNFRKRGIGDLLLKIVLNEAKNVGIESCWLEVRESNLAARKFYESKQFQIAGKRRNYYANPSEDAILLNLYL